MYHSFEVELAKEFGILEAIILNNLEFWIAKNEANEKNFYARPPFRVRPVVSSVR